MQLLTFTLNGMDYGMPLKDVESIENRISCVNVPTAPEHIKGIIRLHGNIIPVFSLTSKFGMAEHQINNMIVANVDGMKIALEVEKVKEIVNVENSHVEPMPVLMGSSKNCFNDVAARQQELIVMLDVAGLVSLEEQEQLHQLIDNNGKI